MFHLKRLENAEAVQPALDNGTMLKPYVAYIQDGEYIDWNTYEHDYSKDYLTFEILTGGNITWYAESTSVTKTIEYSLDDGTTWSALLPPPVNLLRHQF